MRRFFPVWFLYNLLFPVAFVLMLPGFLRRMVRRGQYRRDFGQRLGYYSPEVRRRLESVRGAVWLEAVSVGEMLVALKLISGLRKRAPALPLVVSTTTTTGYALALERVPAGVVVIYTPIDLTGAVRRAFDAILPTQLVVVDGGLWPNQLRAAALRHCPTALVNARLSPRSARRFRRFSRLTKPLFGSLDLVCVPEDADQRAWRELGVADDKIQWTGSVKFDDEPTRGRVAGEPGSCENAGRDFRARLSDTLGVGVGAPVLLAGSTHAGEERLIAEIFRRLRVRFPDLFLIVAPRHVERTKEVHAELKVLGLQVVLRTEMTESDGEPPDVLLINTTGELRDWYSTATLVFIGKSLCRMGGQNPVEAIVADVPVLFGPHMENFEGLVAQLLAAGAAVQVDTPVELESECLRLLADAAERSRLATAAKAQVMKHRGSTLRTADLLLAQRRNSTCKEV